MVEMCFFAWPTATLFAFDGDWLCFSGILEILLSYMDTFFISFDTLFLPFIYEASFSACSGSNPCFISSMLLYFWSLLMLCSLF